MVVVNPCNRLLLNDAGGPSGYDGTTWIPNKVMCSFQASSSTVLTTIKYPHMMDWKAFLLLNHGADINMTTCWTSVTPTLAWVQRNPFKGLRTD